MTKITAFTETEFDGVHTMIAVDMTDFPRRVKAFVKAEILELRLDSSKAGKGFGLIPDEMTGQFEHPLRREILCKSESPAQSSPSPRSENPGPGQESGAQTTVTRVHESNPATVSLNHSRTKTLSPWIDLAKQQEEGESLAPILQGTTFTIHFKAPT